MGKNRKDPRGEKENALQDQESFNGNLTAIPKGISSLGNEHTDLDLMSTPMDQGDMNEADARESGYMDEDGRAVSQQRSHPSETSTGAYTDIGAGRSSVVRPSTNKPTHH